MPRCPTCRSTMTSGEECRMWEATGHCFSCYPGNVLNYLLGEGDGNDERE